MTRAKESVQRPYIVEDLVEISSQYRCLLPAIIQFESSTFTITEAYNVTISLDFGEDMAGVKEYIAHRLSQSDARAICLGTIPDFEPINYSLVQNAQPTSAAVERSFSMALKIIGAKDRPFDNANIWKYIICAYNMS